VRMLSEKGTAEAMKKYILFDKAKRRCAEEWKMF